jgi:ADP-ribosylglycohydrolase
MTKAERFEGCIIGGAIGDAFGSGYENFSEIEDKTVFYPFGKPEKTIPEWNITDDTQLTLATCEALIENRKIKTEKFAEKYLEFYQQRKISGIGASTLKALRELEVGGYWSQVGRQGEYAAGNGAAMRIVPIAFLNEITREQIREICFITHRNDEAYIGALSVIIAIKSILKGTWTGKENLIEIIIDQIPDTRVRDRLIEISKFSDSIKLEEIGNLGSTGYVVNSIPLAIAAANKVEKIGLEEMFSELIGIGGDTDTNCSIAGQIAGTLIGIKNIPDNLLNQLKELNEYKWIKEIVSKLNRKRNWV